MGYADVSKPVIIQASKSLSAKVDNYLRRMCIVSQGGSNLSDGAWKIVGSSQIEEILSTQPGNENAINDLRRKLRGFFAFAGVNKDVMIVEVGSFESQNNPISNQVQKLKNYIDSGDKKSYCHLVPSSWYWPPLTEVRIPDSEISISRSLYALREQVPLGQSLPGDVTPPTSQVTLGLTTNIPRENLNILIEPAEGIVSYDVGTDMLTAVGQGQATITISGKIKSAEGNTALVRAKIKVGPWGENLNLSAEENELESIGVEDRTDNGFRTGGRDLAFLSLVDEHVSMSSKTFFFIDVIKENPSSSEAFQSYANKKSLFAIYDNLVENSSYPLGSIILGIAAGSKYDLSSTQKGTPMNFKSLSGQNFTFLKQSLQKELINAPVNFAGELAGNCVLMNGRYADGSPWEYYYQWNVVEFEIELKLQTLLLNGVNSANSVIQYNQNGIDILKANIKSVLALWQERGVITSFAESFDPATSSMVGEGSIGAVDFTQYIAQNPEDYKNEVYKGFSFYIMIGRYPRQIIIEASLN